MSTSANSHQTIYPLSGGNDSNVHQILYTTLRHLSKLKEYDQAFIFANKEDKFQLVLTYPDHATNEVTPVPLHRNIVDKFITNGEPYIFQKNDPIGALFSFCHINKDSSLILLPLKVNTTLVGIAMLVKDKANYFSKTDIPLLAAFSYQIGIILENANVFRREQKKSAQLAQINTICQKIDSIMNIDELYNRVVDVIHESFGYEHVALYLVDSQKGTISLKSISGIYRNITPLDQTLQFGQGIVGWVVQTGKTVLSNDTQKDPHFYNITPDQTPTQSELCVPIKIENQVIGALNIESRKLMDFDEDDLNSLEVLANRVGVAIQNSRLYQEVQEKSQRLQVIVSSMGQGIITMGRDFKIRWANKTFSDWGWKTEEVLNKHCYELFGERENFCLECPGKKTFKTGKIYQRMIQAKNGRYYLITSAPIKDGYGTVNQILEVVDDITRNIKIQEELEKTKEQLEHSKYLAAIGELTASIAHEIRNPLNALSNAIDILQTDLNVDGDYARLMNVAKEESQRVNNIISHYLKFARTPELKLTLNDIRDTIEETITLLKAATKISKGIDFLTYFADDLPPLVFDRDSIKQVFWNLLINSVEAISSEGLIEIKAEKIGDQVEIRLTDNGKGIAPGELEKIFEPFYSLKAKGTGLGLSIVRRIIEQHNWTIGVESELGKGTSFIIRAPLKQ
ncbi:MAG: GAF domain-containing protein [candidate division KSB1 bacterium]|nr:GAF domain-containing protein [candidate division KSB1 bacterium]